MRNRTIPRQAAPATPQWRPYGVSYYGTAPRTDRPARALPVPRPRLRPRLIIFAVLVVAGVFASHVVQSQRAAAAAQATKEAQAAIARRDAGFQSRVAGLLSAYPTVDVSVVAIPMNGELVQTGTTAPFDGASTGKLLTATDYLHHVEAGSARLDTVIAGQTAQDLLEAMVVNSDNTAWSDLNDYLTHADLGRYAASIGFIRYDPAANTFPAADVALLLEHLYRHRLLNAADTDLLLGYMHRANYRQYMLPAIPAGFTVYHKVGCDDDYLHDAAIITKGSQHLVLAVYTNGHGTYEWDARTQLIQQITKLALTTYFPPDGQS